MTVLLIRAHKRFGVCRGIQLRRDDGRMVTGLLIEVSLEGCRISNIESDQLVAGDFVALAIDQDRSLSAHVRWQRDGAAGLRLVPPLYGDELAAITEVCRAELNSKNGFA